MDVLVLGTGVIGVATAWYLQERGFRVTVVDRQPAAALETSFANGGQISVSHAEPWASPMGLLKVIRWLGREDAPLLFHPRLDLAQWLWALCFLRECAPRRMICNMRNILRLSEYSRCQLQILRNTLNLQYNYMPSGILHFYTQAGEFKRAKKNAQKMAFWGCNRQILGVEQLLALEPSLSAIRDDLVGGDFTATDESGDAHQFTVELFKKAQAKGVRFLFNTQVTQLMHKQDMVKAVEVIDATGCYRTLSADKYVVALSNQSRELLRPLKVNLNLYPAKGYSATFPIKNLQLAPKASISDDEYKMVFTCLGNRFRVAGTAELGEKTRALNLVRCQALTRRAERLFPGLCDYDKPQYWSGLRPATPSNVPYIGQTRYSNLYVNTGHGTLGWTMACGSARALADILLEKRPDVDFCFVDGL